MNVTDAVILGLVQGLTEFLPVSSSGHLIIARDLLGLSIEGGLAYDAVLQLATAIAVLIYFRRDFWALAISVFSWIGTRTIATAERTTLLALVLGTVPAIIAGLLLEDRMETTFRSAALVAWMLIAGSILFIGAEYVAKRIEKSPLSVQKGIAIGLFQCLALIPGVSRSGATISGGLLLGLSRVDAARFGFLLSFPILFGSGLKKLAEILGSNGIDTTLLPLIIGSLVAFGVGLAAIHFLMQFVRTHTLMPFVWYRLALAGLVVIVL